MTIRCRLCGGYLVSACSRVTVYGTVWGPGCRAQKCHRCGYASSYTDWPCRCNSSPTYSPPPSPDEPPPASGSGGGAQSPTGAGGGAGQTAASTAGAAARGAQGSAPASGLGRSRPGGHTATQTPSSGDHRGLRACAAAAADEMHRQALQPEQQARLRQLQQIADIAEQCGLPRCVATQLEDDWEADGLSGGAALVAELREQLRKDARQSLDVPRLVTALRHFRSFLVETGRVAFHSARGDRPCDSERYNRETLDLFQQWVRRNVRKPCGAALKQDTIAGYSGAIRVFLNREARCDMAPPSTNVAMPSVHKTWRREDGPSGARQLMRGLRASHIFEWRRQSAVGAAMAPAGSTEELERGAVALTSHNLLLRGGEPGKQTNAPIDPQRVITWGSVEWLAPREESQGLPWCIMAVVPIKDMGMRKKAYPCPIQRRHDWPLGADLMCTYDALARFYWARAMPGYPFPVDERGRPREHLLGVPVDLHRVPSVHDHAVTVEQEGGALDAHALLSVQGLLAPHAPRGEHDLVWVRQERDGQVVLRLELALRGDAVRRPAQHAHAERAELGLELRERDGLLGAAGGARSRVEEHDHRGAAQAAPGDGVPGVVGQREVFGAKASVHRAPQRW